MTYEETLEYLYTSTPVFQHSGASAYKPGLGTSIALDNLLKNPHRFYKTIHIAGTNGKGSVSHLLAAILSQSGYKTGLYTSPHLVDFRERIKVNGEKISKDYVVNFVAEHRAEFEPLHPSFFELTSTMAFDYFREQQVDIAVIETGLGGRLDSTNIISPILSIITNISPDHTRLLGETVEKIASEKAGIIKPLTPVVIGDVENPEVFSVFVEKAASVNAPLYSSLIEKPLRSAHLSQEGKWLYETEDYGSVTGELGGAVQVLNATTVLAAVRILLGIAIKIDQQAVQNGFANVVELTGLMGRWQQLQSHPRVVCDTGHNTGGWEYISRQLQGESQFYKKLRMVIGAVNDKDIDGILGMMPRNAVYYFTRSTIDRALPEDELARLATEKGLQGTTFPTVAKAIQTVLSDASPDDLIFIGGSTFIVAEALPLFLTDIN